METTQQPETTTDRTDEPAVGSRLVHLVHDVIPREGRRSEPFILRDDVEIVNVVWRRHTVEVTYLAQPVTS